ncbi:Lreu_0056 family protein [Limosilactobacillus reuteri]|uniref:Lreu_0056 family protein n=1 Tax=Limosilactobacillus reuteri TaxID=1598 RepID=UPI001C5AB81B|nr:hypothetical protein [Limosilactobacillus reuteri]MBW3351330.1 hypothetical protein [Limosilactobacillus reuteri]UUW68267.1 hypothetical protein NUJ10_09730 [Limosilactobacillus reuteri]
MIKKKILIAAMSLTALALAGCGNSQSNSQAKSSTSSSQSSVTAQQSSSSNKAQEQSSSTSTASESNLSPQQLGTLVALYQDPDWFKEYLKDGFMYYGTEDGSGKDIAGYNYVTANGDPTSFIYFKQNGDDVTIKQIVPKDDETVAEASFETKHITVSQLLSDYYVNQSQKDEVNGYANQLKPESQYQSDMENKN